MRAAPLFSAGQPFGYVVAIFNGMGARTVRHRAIPIPAWRRPKRTPPPDRQTLPPFKMVKVSSSFCVRFADGKARHAIAMHRWSQALHSHPSRSPCRRRSRQPQAPAPRRLHPPAWRRHLQLSLSRQPVDQQDHRASSAKRWTRSARNSCCPPSIPARPGRRAAAGPAWATTCSA